MPVDEAVHFMNLEFVTTWKIRLREDHSRGYVARDKRNVIAISGYARQDGVSTQGQGIRRLVLL